jgi:uncharacterized protein
MQTMDRNIEHDETSHRGTFFIEQEGKRIAELTYARASDSLIVIDHTEVEPSLRGQGVARNLLLAAVNWARASHIKVKPTCPYAVVQFARDQSIRDVLA